jgi:hypothetical protein
LLHWFLFACRQGWRRDKLSPPISSGRLYDGSGSDKACPPERQARNRGLENFYAIVRKRGVVLKIKIHISGGMSAMAFLWQKEKEPYIYDRREWAKGEKIIVICLLFIMAPIFWARIMDTNSIIFYFCFVGTALLTFADYGSLRISLTASKICLHQGFWWHKRTIYYNEIVDIAFRDTSKFVPKRKFRKQNQYFEAAAFFKDKRILINVHNPNDYCIVNTSYAHDVLNAIRKVQPHIKID